MQFSMPKLTRKDWTGIGILVIVVIVLAIPVYYRPNPDCEVAQAGYKCVSAKTALVENCNAWARYSCDSTADISLPQVEWYIGNLCQIHNDNHADKLDCSNLKQACDQVLERA